MIAAVLVFVVMIFILQLGILAKALFDQRPCASKGIPDMPHFPPPPRVDLIGRISPPPPRLTQRGREFYDPGFKSAPPPPTRQIKTHRRPNHELSCTCRECFNRLIAS